MAALENERLFTEEIEKKRLESEISIALEIQKNLLPKEPPITENFDIYGFSLPTYQVGGDYFDYIKIDENRLLLAIADVSGKGIPASLIMANTQAALRVLARNKIDPVSIANQINSLLYENTSPDKFVTCFFGVLDQTNNQFTYLNAGHNPPYLFKSDGTMHELHEGGLILGFMEHDFGYNTGNVKLESGDLIIMFTDGVTESHNIAHEEYGEQRLLELIKEVKHHNSFDIAQAISADVKKFAGNCPQFDDITTIVLKCLG
jgi:sigma-B regulation protein RsbU (phosphoserine phosphatase)